MIVTTILVILLTAFLAEWLRRRIKIFKTFKDAGIPGPTPHWLFGNILEIKSYRSDSDKEDLIKVKERWIKTHGKVVGYYDGINPTMLISDLDMLKEILVRDSHNFTDRPILALTLTTTSIVSINGQEWRDKRKMITPVFSSAKIKKMLPIMQSCINSLIEVMEKKADSDLQFNAYELMQCLTMDVIDQCALDFKWDCLRNKERREIQSIRQFLTLPSYMAFLLRVFPSVVSKLFPPLSLLGLIKNERILDEIISGIKEKIKSRIASGKTKEDALQMLMDANVDNGSGPGSLTEQEVADNAFMFVIAGFETSSNALAYAFHLLSQHTDVQDRVREEVLQVIGDSATPSYEDINKLVYTEAVLMETLRLFPPITGFVNRVATNDWNYGEYTLNAGQIVEVPIWSIHHNSEIYPNPEKFDPERFMPDERSSRHPMAWIPFGAGPRNCIGLRFAMVESILCVAMVVRKFFIDKCDKSQEPLPTRTVHVITHPADGTWMKIRQRI